MRRKALATLALTALLALGCAPLETVPEPAPWVLDTLYFGAQQADGTAVDAEKWEGFLDQAVTPRFPEGLTHWKAQGQWKDDEAEDKVGKEGTWVLQIAHPRDEDADTRLQELIEAYKTQFKQKSVLRLRSAVEPAF